MTRGQNRAGNGPQDPDPDEIEVTIDDSAGSDSLDATESQDRNSSFEETFAQASAEMIPGIPDVEIQSTLGTGGQGVVYAGMQEYLNRRVAVKVLHQHVHPKLSQRFRREATILAGLQHPNIVTCFAAGVTEDDHCYMVMEFIDGPDLHRFVKDEGPMEEELALALVKDVAKALNHGLELSVIHRDVKPQNVLLQSTSSQDGGEVREIRAKLADLGLARFTVQQEDSIELTVQGAVLGTPTTMSPEQYDNPDSVDHRTDIYGLGCVLYYAIAGRPPFHASSMSALYQLKTSKGGMEAVEQTAGISAPAMSLILAMLAPDAEDRPQTYADLIRTIDEVRRGIPLQRPKAPTSSGRRSPVPLIAGLALVAVGLAGFILMKQGDSESPNGAAGTEATARSEDTNDLLQNNGGEAPASPADQDANERPESGPSSVETGVGTVQAQPMLAAGSTLRPFADWTSKSQHMANWTGRDDPQATWFEDERTDPPRYDVVRGKTNGSATRGEVSHAVPAGSWELSGTVGIGKKNFRGPNRLNAGIGLQWGEEHVLWIEVSYDNEAKSGGASVKWQPLPTTDDRAELKLATAATIPAELDVYRKAFTEFVVRQQDGRVFVSVGGLEPQDITPQGADGASFRDLRLFVESGTGIWHDFEYRGL